MSLATLLAAKEATEQKLLDAMKADIATDAIAFRPDSTGTNTVQRAAYIDELNKTLESLEKRIAYQRQQEQGMVNVFSTAILDE